MDAGWTPAPAAASGGGVVIVCPACGESNTDRARFCQSCGRPLPLAVPALAPIRRPSRAPVEAAASVAVCEVLDAEENAPPDPRARARAVSVARVTLERHGARIEGSPPRSERVVVGAFGTDGVHGDGALRALHAVAEIRDAFREINERLDGPAVSLRAGVASARVIRREASGRRTTFSGPALDEALDLRERAAPGEVLVADATRGAAGGAATVEPDGADVFRLIRVSPEELGLDRPDHVDLVGREQQLARVREAFERAVSDAAGRLALVVGEPGIGTSRLMEEFLRELEGDVEVSVVHATCARSDEGGSIATIADVIEQAIGIDPADSPSESRTKLERVLAAEEASADVVARVTHLMGIPGGRAVSEETNWAVRRLLESVARRRPLLLAVEDVDLAEPTLLALLRHVASRSTDVPILVLCTAGPSVLEHVDDWGSEGGVTLVRLQPPSEAECSELIERFLGKTDLPETARRSIARTAGNNPFVVEQMVATLIEEGLLRKEDGRWTTDTDLAALPTPPSVRALLGGRIRELSPDERDVLRRAAVIGESFEWDELTDLLPDDARPAAGDHLQSLCRKHVLRPIGGSGDGRFEFGHAMLRDAAEADLDAQTRAELHLRVAERFEALAADRPGRFDEILAAHLDRALRAASELGRVDDGTRQLAARTAAVHVSAGARATERGDATAAARLLERASALVPVDDLRRPALLLDASTAIAALGDAARAESVLSLAVRSARTVQDRRVEWRAKVLRARVAGRARPDQRALEAARRMADRALAAFEELGDDWGLASAWLLRGFVHVCRGHATAQADAAERAAEHARRAGRASEETEALRAWVQATLQGPAPVQEATRRCERILDRARGRRVAEQEALGVLAVLTAERGRFDQARRLISRAMSAAEDLGLDEEIATAAHRTALIETLAGDAVAAERAMRRGYVVAERAGDEGARARLAASLAHLAYEEGRHGEALRMSEVSESGATGDDVATHVAWRTARAKALAQGGNLEQADALAREAVRLAEQTDSPGLRADALAQLAEVLELQGRSNEALPFVRKAARAYARKGSVVRAERARAMLDRLAGRTEPGPDAGAAPTPVPGDREVDPDVAPEPGTRDRSPDAGEAEAAPADRSEESPGGTETAEADPDPASVQAPANARGWGIFRSG